MGLLHCLLHPLAGLDGGMNRRISCTVAVARNIKGHSRTFDVRFVLVSARMIMYDNLFAVA
jgi:hypothetical protein